MEPFFCQECQFQFQMHILKDSIQIRKGTFSCFFFFPVDQDKLCTECTLKTNFMKVMTKMECLLSISQPDFVFKLVLEFFILNRIECLCNFVIFFFPLKLFLPLVTWLILVPKHNSGIIFAGSSNSAITWSLISVLLFWKLCVYCYIYPCVRVKALVAQSCPTLCDPVDYSLPGSSVHGIP